MPSAAITALIIEHASRLILGASAGHWADMVALQALAIERAQSFLTTAKLDRLWDEARSVAVDWVVPDLGVDLETKGIGSLRLPPQFNVFGTGERRFGLRLISRLGSRFGGLHLLPYATAGGRIGRSSFPSKKSSATAEQADELVVSAALRHNEEIIRSIHRAASVDLKLIAIGSMGTRLGEAAAAIGAWTTRQAPA